MTGTQHAGRGGPVVAIANQKGGVGKTTVALGIASSAARSGRRVLVVDLDPQANATSSLGITEPAWTTNDVLHSGEPGSARAPVDPAGTVALTGADGQPVLRLGLPDTPQQGDAAVAADGTVTYDDPTGKTALAVQALPDGVRAQTVTAACSPLGPYATVCALAGAAFGALAVDQFTYARSQNKCIRLRYTRPGLGPAAVVGIYVDGSGYCSA